MEPERKIIAGPRWQDLEDALAQEVLAIKDKDSLQPVVILVGSNLLAQYLSRELARRRRDAGLNLRILTFLEMAYGLGRSFEEPDVKPEIPDLGQELIMRDLADEIPEKDYFRPVANTPGFRKTALATYRDIKDARLESGLSGQGVESAAAWVDMPARDKLKSFFQLVNRFEQKRKEFLLVHDRFETAIKNAAMFTQIFGAQRLLAYGFYDFTAAQWCLLAALAKKTPLTIFMPYEKDSITFQFAEKTIRRFQEAGFDIEATSIEAPEGSSLEIIQKYFGMDKTPPEQNKNDGSFMAIAAAGEDREVKAIARYIMKMVKERELSFHEIGILVRNRTLYQPLFEEIFSHYQIPLFIQDGKPLSETPAGRMIMLFLELADSEYPRSQIMEFLCSGKWNMQKFSPDAEPGLPFRFDIITREAGVVEGKDAWLKKILQLKETLKSRLKQDKDFEKKSPEDIKREIEDADMLLSFMETFFTDMEGIREQDSWESMAQRVIELARKYILLEDDEHERLNKSIQVLKELDMIQRNKKIDIGLFRELLQSALQKSPGKNERFQEGCVCLSDLMPARGVRFRLLIIPGLVEKSFPIHPREDPIMLDEERKHLNSNLDEKVSFIPLKGEQINEELMLFYLALNQAKDSLLLSWPRLDLDKNRERVPSFFLLRTLEVLAGEKLRYIDLKNQKEWVKNMGLAWFAADEENQCLDSTDQDLYRTSLSMEKMEPALATYLAEVNPFLKRGAEAIDSRLRVGNVTRFDGYVRSKDTTQILERHYKNICKGMSPSRLENWADCPFKYFLERVLRVHIQEEPEEVVQISALDRGTLMHKALEVFFKKLAAEHRLPLAQNDPEKLGSEIQGQVIDISREYEDRGLTGYRLMWEKDRNEIVEDLGNVIHIDMESGEELLPEGFEKPFEVPLQIGSGQKITLTGKIDRLDAGRDAIRVIDYKSGSAIGYKNNSFMNGQALQLPVYLYAALTKKNIRDARDSWAEYFFISRRGEFRQVRFDGEGWEEALNRLKELISIILSGIREGLFMPWQEECYKCDYKLACFRPQRSWIKKKTADPKAEAYHRLREGEFE